VKSLILILLFASSCLASDSDVDVSIYDSSEPGKVVLEIHYNGCKHLVLVELEKLKNQYAIDAIANHIVKESKAGCKGG
jgi:hypothetical protein